MAALRKEMKEQLEQCVPALTCAEFARQRCRAIHSPVDLGNGGGVLTLALLKRPTGEV